MYRSRSQYRANILELRKSHKLHTEVEHRFIRILRQVDKKAFAIHESSTLSRGHRVDLKFHLNDGRTLHAEIFASAEMVSRDINSLTNSIADVRLALLLDEDVDKSVADAYFHELGSRNQPLDLFPIIKLSSFMVSSQSMEVKRRLCELLGFAEFARLGRIALNDLRQPAMEWYVGKSNEQSALNEIIQSLRSNNPKNLFVTGPRGIGKSSLLNALEQSFIKNNIYFIKRTVDTEDWRELLGEITKDTISLLDNKGFKTIDVGMSASAPEALTKVAVDAANKFTGGIVYIIDQFERLFERGIEEVTQLEVERVWRSYSDLAASLCSNAKVTWIITAREQYYFMIFPRMGHLHEYNFSYLYVCPFQISESIKLVQRVSDLTGFHLTEGATELLAEKGSGHPQNILLCFINIFSARDKEGPVNEVELERRQPWSEVFEADLERLNTEEKLVLFAMAETLQEITTLKNIFLRLSSQIEIDESMLRNILRRLQDNLSLIKQPRRDVFEFFHARFADYIREKHGHEFPPEWSIQRLIETALILVKEQGEKAWLDYRAVECMEKALKHSISNYYVFFKASEMLERSNNYAGAITALLTLKRNIPYLCNEHGRLFYIGMGEAPKLTEKDVNLLYRIDEQILVKLVHLTNAMAQCDINVDDRMRIFCRLAMSLRNDYEFLAEAIIKQAADLVMQWKNKPPPSEFELLPDYGDILQSFGYEEAAIILFTLRFKSINYRAWLSSDHRKAISLLKNHGRHREALDLLLEASKKTTGVATKAEHLYDAAALAYEIDKKKALQLYRELIPLAEYLQRTSRTAGAEKKWGTILDIAKSRSVNQY